MALLVGLLIGLTLGLTGAGGAAFALPLLILLVGLPVQQAIGLSLAAVALGAGYGAVRRARDGDVFLVGCPAAQRRRDHCSPGRQVSRHPGTRCLADDRFLRC